MQLSEKMTLPGQVVHEFVHDFPGLLGLFNPRHVSTTVNKLQDGIPD
jgi:hypothetical protein